MKNRLRIEKADWPDVTSIPHFIVDLVYEGYGMTFEDIYFDHWDRLPDRLAQLKTSRRGSVRLDGGFRFSLYIEMLSNGDSKLRFHAESDASFPGEIKIKGYFYVDGERVSEMLDSSIALFRTGRAFVL